MSEASITTHIPTDVDGDDVANAATHNPTSLDGGDNVLALLAKLTPAERAEFVALLGGSPSLAPTSPELVPTPAPAPQDATVAAPDINAEAAFQADTSGASSGVAGVPVVAASADASVPAELRLNKEAPAELVSDWSDAQQGIDDAQALARDTHRLVSEIHAVVKQVGENLPGMLTALEASPFGKMFGGLFGGK